jgi:subtilisin family serine protease
MLPNPCPDGRRRRSTAGRLAAASLLAAATPAVALAAVKPADPAARTRAATPALVAAHADADAPTGYAYFDTFIEVDVDPTMVAVFLDPDQADLVDLAARRADGLARAGMAGAEFQPSSVPGWTYVVLPEDEQSAAAALARVAALHGTGVFDMVSPVYLGQGGLPLVPTRDVLVQFRDGLTVADRDALLAARGLELLEGDFAGTPGLVRARSSIDHGRAMFAFAAELNAHPDTVYAQSDAIFWARRSLIPNDPLFPQQWALDQSNDQDMDAPEAWDLETGSPDITVVVLDSGIQQDHPDLTQLPGSTFAAGGSGGGPINQCDNHGTAVAGCIAATIDNGTGVVGIAPDATVRSGKIFNEIFFIVLCLPFLESQDSWTVAGINWSLESGARVTNSSWGGGAASAAITSAFNATRAAGMLHFAAAGNDGTGTLGYPASLASVNAVCALNSSGTLASFSTFGPGTFIAAPGASVLTTDRTGGDGYSGGSTTTIDGTSFASPYAAGVAALVLSVNPGLTPAEVEQILADSAVDRGPTGYDSQYGWGFVNAHAAVVLAGGGGEPCPADVDQSGAVGFDDLLLVLAGWGECAGCPSDVDGSGTVDFNDVLSILAAFGPCP